jgi:hypothetical protein
VHSILSGPEQVFAAKKIKIIVANEINAAVQIIALRGLLRQAKE